LICGWFDTKDNNNKKLLNVNTINKNLKEVKLMGVFLKGNRQPLRSSEEAAKALFRGFATRVLGMSASTWQRHGFRALAGKPSKYLISVDPATTTGVPLSEIGRGLKTSRNC